MAAISVKESDFAVLASAAMEAKDREDLVEAVALDKVGLTTKDSAR